MKKNIKREIIAVLLIIIFVIAVVPKVFQNDTFYTITVGRDILKYGFDGVERYSWVEGLSYTSPHWLFDVVNYLIYNVFDFCGLYVFVMILASVQMLLFYWILRKKDVGFLTSLIATLIVTYLLKDSFTDRAQIVSYIMFLLEIYLLNNIMEKKSKLSIFGMFIVSLVIANVHCGAWILIFVLMLPYLGEYIVSFYKINPKPNKNAKIIVERNPNIKYLILVVLVVILGGLLTPTGDLPFTYFIRISMGNTMGYISEHTPLIVASSVGFVVFSIIAIACIGFMDMKLKLSDGFLIIGLYFMAIVSKRHLVLLILLCAPILIKIIDNFIKKYTDIDREVLKEKPEEEKKEIERIFAKAEKIFFVFIICFTFFVATVEFTGKINDDYIDEDAYPVQATEFILNYIEENNISTEEFRLYNEYNYGSYLLYKGIPVFIDSRCDLYTPEFNDGISVFDDHVDVYTGKVSYTELFEKYNINYAIVTIDSLENTYMKEDECCVELYSDDNFVFYKFEQ